MVPSDMELLPHHVPTSTVENNEQRNKVITVLRSAGPNTNDSILESFAYLFRTMQQA